MQCNSLYFCEILWQKVAAAGAEQLFAAKLMNPRLRRAAAAAFRHRNSLVWALYAAGIVAFLLLPLLSSSGYLDEKALLIGIIPATWKSAATATAIAAHRVATTGVHLSLALLVAAAEEAAAGSGTSLQAWQVVTGGGGCEAVYRLVPAGRGDGTEALALVLPVDLSKSMSAALAASVGVTASKQLTEAAWLAKDVAVALVDSTRCSSLEATQAWLDALDSSDGSFSLPQLGQVQQALVLEVESAAATEARLGVHGHGGQLPNMDMVFLAKRNLDYFTGRPVGLDVGWAPAYHAQHAPTGAAALAGQAANAAAFAARLASGQPSGAHAAFLRRGIDALSLTLRRPAAAAGDDGSGQQWSAPAARDTAHFALTAAEMVLHTCNNLQEKLHHSNALYLLVSPERFVSVGAHLAPPVCLLLAALLQAAGRLEAARGSSVEQWQEAWAQAIVVHGSIALVLLGWQHGAAGITSLIGAACKAAVTLAGVAAGVCSLVQWGKAWAAGTAEEQCSGSEKVADAGSDGRLVGMQTARAAMIVCVLAVEASALLLFKWAVCYLLLLIAVPTAQLLLPGVP